MPTIRFYYDIVCPYAYIASTRIEACAQAAGADVQWCPVLLGGIYKHWKAPQLPTDTWAQTRVEQGRLDLIRQAAWRGVPLHHHPQHPLRTVSAMRLLIATPQAARPALSKALFAAYWVDNQDITDRGVLDALARAHGVDPAVIDSSTAREALYASTDEAIEAGAFGVPSMVVGERMWWGQDRLHMVAAALGKPRPQAQKPRPSTIKEVTFFHDFASPFSYLGATQIAGLAQRYGVTVQWCPILLGALFRDIGTPNVPLLAMNEAKQRHMMRELHDWSQWWGVPFQFPSTFPVRSVLPLRVSILEPRAIAPLYHALWAQGQDIGQPEVVRAVLTEHQLDPTLIEQTQQPEVKAQLLANTTRARSTGVCGVPTVEVDGQLIWGQDRLDMLEAIFRGEFVLPPV